MNTQKVYGSILDKDGGTFETHFGISERDTTFTVPGIVGGYFVSDKGAEAQYRVEDFTPRHLAAYVGVNATALHYGFLGAWVEDGIVYLDVSRHYGTDVGAATAAANNGQLAYWDIEARKAIAL